MFKLFLQVIRELTHQIEVLMRVPGLLVLLLLLIMKVILTGDVLIEDDVVEQSIFRIHNIRPQILLLVKVRLHHLVKPMQPVMQFNRYQLILFIKSYLVSLDLIPYGSPGSPLPATLLPLLRRPLQL